MISHPDWENRNVIELNMLIILQQIFVSHDIYPWQEKMNK